MKRWVFVGLAAAMVASGCGGRKSALLLERRTKGPLVEASGVAHGVAWQLQPVTQSQQQGGVEVTATFASPGYLQDLFRNRDVFGPYAGSNPFFPENIVFYVKIANRSQQRIRIEPGEFVLVDNRGNQYAPLNVDYVSALEESKRPVAAATRGVLSEAKPGYFGVGIPVGRLFAGKPQGRFALIKQSSLQGGFLYPGVVHDGLVTFWSPNQEAASLRLIVTNVKIDFDANDLPRTSLEFPFQFETVRSTP